MNGRRPGREAAERRARRTRMRVGRNAARAIIVWGMTDTHSLSSIPARRVMLTGAGALKQSPGWA